MRYPYLCRAVQTMSAVFFDSAWTFILVCHALNTHRFQCLSISASYKKSVGAVVQIYPVYVQAYPLPPCALHLTNVQTVRTNRKSG